MDLPHQKTLFGISFEEQFSAIDIPIMVIRSSESQLLPEAVLQRMHSLPINVSYIDVPGSAHPVPYSESLISTIQEFIVDFEKILKYDFDGTSEGSDNAVLRLFNFMAKLPEFQLI